MIDLNLLLGSTSYFKDEELIKPNIYTVILDEYAKIKGMEPRAVYLFSLIYSPSKHIAAAGRKLQRLVISNDRFYYERYIAHYITNLRRSQVTSGIGAILLELCSNPNTDHNDLVPMLRGAYFGAKIPRETVLSTAKGINLISKQELLLIQKPY